MAAIAFPAFAEAAERGIATIANTWPPDSPAPEGMLWIPGGEFSMDANLAGGGSCCELPIASNDFRCVKDKSGGNSISKLNPDRRDKPKS